MLHGLPERRDLNGVPVNAVAIEEDDSQRLWLGTDIGMYKSTNGGGLWFSRDDLSRLESRAPKGSAPPAAPTALPPPEARQEAARCICRDRPLMALVDRLGVTIDVCPSCGGVWLDAGEIDRILQCYAELGIDPAERAARVPGPAYEGPAGTPGGTVMGMGVADLVLGFLFDFVSAS